MMMEASGDLLEIKSETSGNENIITTTTSLEPTNSSADNNSQNIEQQQKFHEQQQDNNLTTQQETQNSNNVDLECSNYNHQCYICDKIFSANSNLNRHLRKIHQENVQSPYNNIKCALCEAVCSSSIIYNQHLENDHKTRIEVEQLTFATKATFEEWKHSIESQTTSQFIKSRGEKKTKNVNKTYYSCNRSGYYVSKARTRKALKKQGSRKINGRCPASMNVTVNPDSTYDVRFVKTHVGHDFELKHLDLSDKDRDLIVQKLVSGVTKREIIKQIRGSATEQHGTSNTTASSESPSSEVSGTNLPVVVVTSASSLTENGDASVEIIPTTNEIVIYNTTSSSPVVCTITTSSETVTSNNTNCTTLSTNLNSQPPTSRLHLATTKDIHNIINSKQFKDVQAHL